MRVCACGQKHYAKGMCKKHYLKQFYKNLYAKHPELRKEKLSKFHAGILCKTLKQHHEEQKDNLQHLSTEFIWTQIEELRKNKK